MTKDTEALREALAAHYPTGEWMQPCGNHVLCCSCGENLWGVDRDACKAAWRTHVIEALSTPASAELGFDPTAEVGDEVFPHDTIGSHFGNGGGLDPAARELDDLIKRLDWPSPKALRVELISTMREAGQALRDALYTHPPHLAPVDPVAGGEALREAVRDALASELGDTYDCGRVWEAWSVGTMGEDDFTPVNDRVDEIADAILAALKGPAA